MKYSFFSQFDSLASKIFPNHLERTSPLALTLFQIPALTKLKRKCKMYMQQTHSVSLPAEPAKFAS